MNASPKRSSLRPIRFNMTPMIDVVFLLVIFFMLVSQFSSAEHVEIEVPDPYDSQATEVTIPEKVIINVQYMGEDLPPAFLIGSLNLDSLDELSRRLQRQHKESPDLEVVLRADKRVPYRYVRQAMQVIAANRIEIFHIVAKPENAP
jgi:biopolymer transport protein ExbD